MLKLLSNSFLFKKINIFERQEEMKNIQKELLTSLHDKTLKLDQRMEFAVSQEVLYIKILIATLRENSKGHRKD